MKMERFYYKKCWFAVIFCVVLALFCIQNWKQEWGKLTAVIREEAAKIESLDDVAVLTEVIEDTIAEELAGRMKFIESYGWIQRLIGKKESNNFTYIKDKSDMLQYAAFYRKEDENVPEYAKRIRRLKEYVEPYGTKVLFIAPPGKYMPGKSALYYGMPINDSNRILDEFLYELKKNQVDVLDLRPYFENTDDITYEEMFYKTDHHWTSRAALLAVFQIVEEIEKRYGDDWDPENKYCDLSRYHIRKYHNSMLGSMGRNTGITFSGLDDFELIWPMEEGDYIFEAINGESSLKQQGSFVDSFFYERYLNNRDPYAENKYGIYLAGNNRYDHVINKENETGAKVLMLKDSYFSPVISFLASMCSEIEAYWTLSTNDKVDIEQQIRENRYDYILIELYPYNIEDNAIAYFKTE